jgi:hypothetical protein
MNRNAPAVDKRQPPRRAPWLIVIVCALAIAGVVGLLARERVRPSDPGQTVMDYLQASDRDDCKTTWQLTSRETKQEFGLDAGSSEVEGSQRICPPVRGLTGAQPKHQLFVKNVQVQGDKAKVIIGVREVIASGPGGRDDERHGNEFTYACVREQSRWKLDFAAVLRESRRLKATNPQLR